ncbi:MULTISPECIES: hypothetical protein [unclassified Bradyrhizobium]|uniref:hypothetical protein n=1 Tax=unclassified Bradyrhizobium TaxID=2631580 RepID=UPI002306798B|nr:MULTISPECIES: hypothetical protein [unclassified Bradyrhizobium]
MPLLKCFGLLATCRVSLGLYNTREEIDVLCVSLSGRGNCSRNLASVHVARQLALSSAASDRTRHHHRSKRASVGKYRSIGKPVSASRPCCRLSSFNRRALQSRIGSRTGWEFSGRAHLVQFRTGPHQEFSAKAPCRIRNNGLVTA